MHVQHFYVLPVFVIAETIAAVSVSKFFQMYPRCKKVWKKLNKELGFKADLSKFLIFCKKLSKVWKISKKKAPQKIFLIKTY